MQIITPKVTIAIAKQLQDCIKKAPDGINIYFNENDVCDMQADIQGPKGTPYEGGIFRCKLAVEKDFPNHPPKGYFRTKIFHPNVSQKGQICVNTLKKDWDPAAWSVCHIFQVIKCLLIVPFPQSALNETAGKMFMDEYNQYFKHAKMLTRLHAMPKQLKVIQNIHQSKIQEEHGIQNIQNKKEKDTKNKWMKRI